MVEPLTTAATTYVAKEIGGAVAEKGLKAAFRSAIKQIKTKYGKLSFQFTLDLDFFEADSPKKVLGAVEYAANKLGATKHGQLRKATYENQVIILEFEYNYATFDDQLLLLSENAAEELDDGSLTHAILATPAIPRLENTIPVPLMDRFAVIATPEQPIAQSLLSAYRFLSELAKTIAGQFAIKPFSVYLTIGGENAKDLSKLKEELEKSIRNKPNLVISRLDIGKNVFGDFLKVRITDSLFAATVDDTIFKKRLPF